ASRRRHTRLVSDWSSDVCSSDLGAAVIDLSNATVLPGMIDVHVHVNTGGDNMARRTLRALANAQIDLAAGFTTVLNIDSRGTFRSEERRVGKEGRYRGAP